MYHDKLKKIFAGSPQLKSVEEHSKNLPVIAAIGIEALNKIKEGTAPDSKVVNEKLNILKAANQPYGEIELCVIPVIEAVVKQKLVALPTTYPIF